MPNGGSLEQAKEMEEIMLRELAWLWPVLALTAEAIVAVILAMLVSRERQGLVGAWAAVAHLAAAALAVAVWLDKGFRAVMAESIVVDGLSLTLAALIGVSGALCVALVRPVLAGTDREAEFYAVLTFASLSATLLGMAADAALLGLAIGALGLATFVMTGYLRGSRRSNEASIKYYIFGTVTGAAMLYGLSWWFGLAGTTNLEVVGKQLAAAPAGIVIASTVLVLFGLGYKAALVPFHFWTPDAYDGAPLPVAAYLSVLPKLAALVALARVLPLALPDDTAGWTTAIAVLAAATMTLGNVAALPQRNVVRLLAYSSIAQSGYLLMGVAALEASDQGLPALVYYAIAYAAMNLAAFAVVLAVQRERGSVDLEAFRGLGRTHPWWTAPVVTVADGVRPGDLHDRDGRPGPPRCSAIQTRCQRVRVGPDGRKPPSKPAALCRRPRGDTPHSQGVAPAPMLRSTWLRSPRSLIFTSGPRSCCSDCCGSTRRILRAPSANACSGSGPWCRRRVWRRRSWRRTRSGRAW